MGRITRSIAAGAVVAAGALAGPGGCVERELQVNTNPQGALVYMNDQEVGRAPFTREFNWYGTYDVAVRMEGYQTLKTKSPVIAPAWQWVPFDLLAEILPFRFKDSHQLSYTLKPLSPEAAEPQRLLGRAEEMRGQLESGDKPPKTAPATRPAKRSTTRPAR